MIGYGSFRQKQRAELGSGIAARQRPEPAAFSACEATIIPSLSYNFWSESKALPPGM